MITLYGGGTPNVFKVLIILSEIGEPFEIKTVNVTAEEQFTPEFVALNPNSKIPVIIDHDAPGGEPLVLAESGAILFYLAEKSGRFLPGEPVTRARTMQWLMFQMASVGPMFGQAIHFRHAAPPGNEYGSARYITEVKRIYSLLDQQVGDKDYVSGNEYTIADMAIYPWAVNYFGTLGLSPEPYPNLGKWFERIGRRPAVQRVAKVNYEMFKANREHLKHADSDSMDRFFGRGRYSTADSDPRETPTAR